MPHTPTKSEVKAAIRDFDFSDFRPIPTIGHVYVFSLIGTPFVKIGHSGNPVTRFKCLRGLSPYDLDPYFVFTPPDGVSSIVLESLVHRNLANKLQRCEWFRIDPFEAADAVVYCASAALTCIENGLTWDFKTKTFIRQFEK